MALPEAVRKIGDAAEALAVESGMTGAPSPGTDNPAIQPPLAAVPEPGTPASKVDPDNYKERFSRYKSTTDTTIAGLRDNLATSQQTITSLQSQVQTLMAQANAAPAKQTEPAPAVTDADPDKDFNAWLDKLPKKIKDEYTEEYLRDQFVIQTSARPAAPDTGNLQALEQKVDHLAQANEKTAAQLYEEAMDQAYPDDKWIQLAKGSDWERFCQKQVSPVDKRTYGALVQEGNGAHDATTVIWVLKQYEQHLLTLNDGGADLTADPLAGQLTPEGGAGGGNPVDEINAQVQTFTLSQVNTFFKDVATGDKYTPEQAASIEKQIQDAQAAGKIIQG